MSTNALNGDLTTPREPDYWEPHYRQLALLPEWAELDEAARARRLLERVGQELHAADAPAQIQALFSGPAEAQIRTAIEMIRLFARQEGDVT